MRRWYILGMETREIFKGYRLRAGWEWLDIQTRTECDSGAHEGCNRPAAVPGAFRVAGSASLYCWCLACAARESVERVPEFYGEGIAHLLAGPQRTATLKADTERLAELRFQELSQRESLEGTTCREAAAGFSDRIRTQILIAVYEECAARGLTFGGGR